MGSSNEILNNIIVMNRGDTHSFSITQELLDDDRLYFGVMCPHQRFEEAIIKKYYTTDDIDETTSTITIVIDPEDTIDLPAGKYYYSIKLKEDHADETTGDQVESVTTLINRTKFIICES